MNNDNEFNNIKKLLVVLLNNKKIILLITIIFIIIGSGFSFFIKPKKYVATTSILFSRVDGYTPQFGESQLLSEIQFNSSILANYKNFIQSDDVLKTVKENLNIDLDYELFKEDIMCKVDGSKIEIEVTYKNKEMAQKISDEIINTFIQKSKDFYKIEHQYTVNYSDESSTKDSVNHVVDIVLFAFIGLFVSCVITYFKFISNPYIVDENDVYEITNNSYITTFSGARITTLNNLEQDKFNILKTGIELKNNDKLKTLLVTSSEQNSTKDYITVNLCKSFAYSNKRVVIIDDNKDSKMKDILELNNISNFKGDLNDLKSSVNKTNVDNLDVLFLNNETNIYNKDEIENLLNNLANDYDYIIVNGNTLTDSSNSIIFSNLCNATIITAELKKSKVNDLTNSIIEIKNINGNLLGIILTK